MDLVEKELAHTANVRSGSARPNLHFLTTNALLITVNAIPYTFNAYSLIKQKPILDALSGWHSVRHVSRGPVRVRQKQCRHPYAPYYIAQSTARLVCLFVRTDHRWHSTMCSNDS